MTAPSSQPTPHDDTLPHAVTCSGCGTQAPSGASRCDSCGRLLRLSTLREPNTVLGSYRLIELLGEGGMGVVYLGEHTKLGRRVAIKILRSEYSENPQAVHRFFAEARAVNKINHQNIVEITDFVENPGSDNYYIMELLKGGTLASVIDSGGVPPLSRSIGIMTQVASALEAVHNGGIIHRDLKPDNVFLIERSGQKDFVKLLDFGVAKLGGENVLSVHSTAAGAILGTPEYMSPEQASGKQVDLRTDIYAFGVMLYELVTGRLPLTGSSFGELVVKHLTVEPKPPSTYQDLPHAVPGALEDVILACLAKDPADRPDSIRTVADRLAAIADREGWPLSSYGDAPRTTGPHTIMAPLNKRTPSELTPVPAAEPAPPIERSGFAGPRSAASRSGASIDALDLAPPRRRGALVAAIAGVLALAAVGAFFAFGRGSSEAPASVIEVTVETSPAGAEVFRAGETRSLGKTPLTVSFTRAERSEELAFRLEGYVATTKSIPIDRPSRVFLALEPVHVEPTAVEPPSPAVEPLPVAKKPAKPPKRDKPKTKPDATTTKPATAGPFDRSGVLDPFEKK